MAQGLIRKQIHPLGLNLLLPSGFSLLYSPHEDFIVVIITDQSFQFYLDAGYNAQRSYHRCESAAKICSSIQHRFCFFHSKVAEGLLILSSVLYTWIIELA